MNAASPSPASGSILVVDDDASHREMLHEVLSGRVAEVLTAASGEEALGVLESRSPDLIILDMKMPGIGGLGTLEAMRERDVAVPTVVLTAFAEVEDAVAAIKLGATDYLRKPIDLTTLDELIDRFLGARSSAPHVASRSPIKEGWVFASPLMQEVLGEIERVARAPVPVLLTGETGTGKEVLAELIHLWGPHPGGPLVRVNVAAIPEGLVESELFGHVQGAFTGAEQDRMGRIEEADGGTLVLDEIGEMQLALQPKLLRVLESGVVRRVGDTVERGVRFRLVSSTNRDLEAEVAAHRFRQDIYYRIAVITIEVPPLRDRPEDVLALARAFLKSRGAGPQHLSPAVEPLLLAHPWPGNVRELRNAILRAGILAPGDRILPEHLPPTIRRDVAAGPSPGPPSLAEIEKQAILDALDRCGDNRTQAAKELGISRRTLLYRLREYRGGDS